MLRFVGQWMLIVAVASGCAAPERRALTPPTTDDLVATLPGDLDVAVRVDVEWLTAELGPSLGQRLLLDLLVGAEDGEATSLLGEALRHSERLWLGFRLGAPLEAAEKVLILRGHFPPSSATAKVAGGVWVESAADVRRPHIYRKPAAAGALTRVYSRGDQVSIWVSEAEKAAVEQMLDGIVPEAPLRPPERGGLSLAAHPEPLRGRYLRNYPQLAQHFKGVRSLEAHLESLAGHVVLEVELGFGTPIQASNAGEILEQLRLSMAGAACVLGMTAQAAQLSVFDHKVRVSAQLGPGEVRGVEACVLGGRCCA